MSLHSAAGSPRSSASRMRMMIRKRSVHNPVSSREPPGSWKDQGSWAGRPWYRQTSWTLLLPSLFFQRKHLDLQLSIIIGEIEPHGPRRPDVLPEIPLLVQAEISKPRFRGKPLGWTENMDKLQPRHGGRN